jgi:hypothetical protein
VASKFLGCRRFLCLPDSQKDCPPVQFDRQTRTTLWLVASAILAFVQTIHHAASNPTAHTQNIPPKNHRWPFSNTRQSISKDLPFALSNL